MKKTLLLFCLGLTVQSISAAEVNPFQNDVNKVAAVSDGTMWKDLAAESFDGGDGTAESPYLIKTAEQLAKVAKDVYDGDTDYADTYFNITADIDLDGHDWYPIGYNYSTGEELVNNYFRGKFDGCGHKITNLTVPQMDEYRSSGLFGSTEEGFELRNLTIESGDITGEMVVGAFVGSNNGIVENCVNKAKVSCFFYYVGGIVGSNYRQGTVKHCTNYGYILAGNESANGMSAGGVVGSNYNMVEECANYGNVETMTTGAGGIVELMEGGTVRNCFNRGAIKGPERLGGIIGEALGRGGNCEVYNCYNAGTINADAINAGAILGLGMFISSNKLTIKDVYNNSDIFSGSSWGSVADFMGNFDLTEATFMTTDEMKADDFVTKLNSLSGSEETVWMADTKNINDGYPILGYMENINTGITSPAAGKDFNVYAAEGAIVVEGAEGEPMQVYTVGGQMVYSGKAASVSSKAGLYVVRVGNKAYKVVVK